MRNLNNEGVMNPAQQNRPMHPNLPHQPAHQFGGNINLYGNQVLGLQQDAMRSQEAGQVVVPVSDHQRLQQLQRQQQQQQQQQRGFPMQPTPQSQMMNRPGLNAAMAKNPQFLVQQEKIREAARMRNQAQAQAQSQNAGNMPNQGGPLGTLQGQIGGLNNLAGQGIPQNSPAMPNLNRPMSAASQQMAGQGTPQQRENHIRQQQQNGFNVMGQRPPTNIQQPGPSSGPSQLQMDGGQQGPRISAMQQTLQNMSPEDRAKAMVAIQQRIMLQKQKNNTGAAAQSEKQSSGASNPQLGRPQMPPHGQNFGQRVAGQIPVSQGMVQGIQNVTNPQDTTIGTAPRPNTMQAQPVPQNFNPSNQPSGQSRPTHQLSEDQLQYMDSIPYPPSILSNRVQLSPLPPGIDTWGALKTWVSQNMSRTREGLLDQLRELQSHHFQRLLAKPRENAANSMVNNQRQPSTSTQQQGPAPPAPMMHSRSNQPSDSQPSQNISQSNQNIPQPPITNRPSLIQPQSAQDFQAIRSRFPPMKDWSDDQIRRWFMQKKREVLLRAQESGTNPQGPPEDIQRVRNQQFTGQMLGVNGLQPNQNRSPNTTERGTAPTSQNKWNGVSPATQISNQNRQGGSAPGSGMHGSQIQKGVKRNSDDDPVEVPNPNILEQQRRAPGPSKQVQPQQNSGISQNRNEKSAATGRQASSQYEIELRNQALQKRSGTAADQSSDNPDTGIPRDQERQVVEHKARMRQRLQQIYQEVMQTMPPLKALLLDQQTKQRMTKILHDSHGMMKRNESFLHHHFESTGDEHTARDLIRAVSQFICLRFLRTSLKQGSIF